MKTPLNVKTALLVSGVVLTAGLVFWNSRTATAQNATPASPPPPAGAAAPPAQTNATAAAPAPNTNAPPQATAAVPPAAGATNAPATPTQQAAAAPPGNPGPPPGPAAPGTPPQPGTAPSSDGVQLSFQGADVNMVVQWLANTTGKSVVKHPQVQCQLTIVSSKSLTARDAIDLVYRALALEGFSVVETSKSILIVPEGREPKASPELLASGDTQVPDGRQRLLKIFTLEHANPNELKEKIRGVLSDKASIDINDRSNQLIVTDYNENIRLLSELIKELDIASSSDTVIEIYPLEHSEADELANLLTLILNARAAPPGAARRGGSSSSMPPGFSMPGMPMPDGGSPPPSSGGGSASRGSSSDEIRVWTDKTANRLIVAAPKAKLPEVERLIDLLDTAKPQDVAVRVLPLRHVDGGDLVKEIGPLYQKMSGNSVKDTIEVTANTRSNSLIILSNEENYQGIAKLVETLDTENAQQKVIRSFPLKNADAQDVAKQLQELSQDQQQSRYYYYFSAPTTKDTKMSVVADRRRNTVIVQAAPAAIEGVVQMIKELDAPVGDESLAPKIFPLKYVSAADLEEVLNELLLKKTQQRTYWFYDENPPETADRDVGRLYGKVRIISEPYSNSLIVTSNSPENLSAVEDVIKQLDRPSEAGETTLRVGLKFAQAVDVATSLNILFARGGSPPLRQNPQQGQPNQPNPQNQQNAVGEDGFELERETKEDAYYPWLGGQQENTRSSDGRSTTRPVSDLIGRVRAVPDRRSNSLLITSNVHFFPEVMKLITDLDAPTAQVLIEAKIVEVSTDFRDKLGVRWSPDGTRVFDADDLDNSVKISTGASYRDVFAGTAMADSLRTGILDTSVNLDFLVQFLRKNTDSTVLAEPQVNVSDNEIGKLFVGSRVPFISGSLNTPEGARNDSFQYRDVGVILEVTPHINNAEDVALKIRAESSNIRNGQTLFGGAILDTRNFKTDLLVKSGQTIVLGGIIQREDVDTVRKVPVLGSIPGLGWAFKKKDKVSRNVELLVFLRPRITRTPQEAKQLMGEVEDRTPNLKKWKEKEELEQEAPKD